MIAVLWVVACLPPTWARTEEAPRAEPASPLEALHQVGEQMQAEIDAAIERGVAYLRKHQRLGGRGKAAKANGTFPALYTPDLDAPLHAFLLYTLVRCGVDPEDEAFVQGMRAKRIYGEFGDSKFKNYGYAAHVLFNAAWIEAVQAKYAKAVRVPKSLRRRMAEAKRSIAKTIEAFEKNRATHIWRYPGPWPGSRSAEDLSATQYVMLAIKAAMHVGVIKPKRACELCTPSLVYLLGSQEGTGPKVRLKYVQSDADSTRYGAFVEGREVLARGWSYIWEKYADDKHQTDITGSMTAAGVACLAIAKEVLVHAGVVEPNNPAHRSKQLVGDHTLADLDAAILSGWAKLGTMFTVEQNPGSGAWHYYWLYGVERAGALLGVPNMGEHRWYRLGAQYLLAKQEKSPGLNQGRWPGSERGDHRTERTCFALLFLKRATKAPPTPLLPPVTTE